MILRDTCNRLGVVVVLVLFCIKSQLSSNRSVVMAFPSIAGSCFAGDSAARGSHASRTTTVNATLPDLNIQLKFGGSIYQPNATIPLLPGVEYTVIVDAIDPAFFRGILLRFQALDGQSVGGSVMPKDNTQLLNTCTGPEVIGISHKDSNLKTFASGRFRTDNPGRVQLDVTVVIGNEPELSLYGHANYLLDVLYVGQGTPTTFSPVAPPSTSAPTLQPIYTSAPVVPAPVPVAVVAPIFAPIYIPAPVTSAPVVVAATVPVDVVAPIFAPVYIPAPVTAAPAPEPTSPTSTSGQTPNRNNYFTFQGNR